MSRQQATSLFAVLLAALAFAGTSAASPDDGTFAASDPLLTRIWVASVQTATAMLAHGPLAVDTQGRPCAIDVKVVILDGLTRDRCPYIGDDAVTGKALLLASGSSDSALRDAIVWFAAHQHADGAIPASPLNGDRTVLFDYNAYWVETLYDYVLHTGDIAVARRVWPQLVRLLDGWYRAHIGPEGLLVNDLGPRDYAFIRRTGKTVAYYNAGYVRALGMAARLAGWVGDEGERAAWRRAAVKVAAVFGPAFWDPQAGAFRDSAEGTVVHPQDGNAFAVLAGLATPHQRRSALDFLALMDWRSYGAAIADNDTWDAPDWGHSASQRVYPFISYFEAVARFTAGLDASALALIRREWGYMLNHGPKTTMWETIGPLGKPVNEPSWSHGWSSGAAPALSEFVLGVAPTSPGFATFSVRPHTAGLAWARGKVPTPHGTIQVAWTRKNRTLTLKLVAPTSATVVLPVVGRTLVDGRRLARQVGETKVAFRRGTHVVSVEW